MSQNSQYQQVPSAITYIYKNFVCHPSLSELAEFVGASEFHVQRLFKQWVGINPKQYVQFLLGQQAISTLLDEDSLLDVFLALGLSSCSRLHDLIVKITALTPAEARAWGAGVTISYGFSDSPLGRILIGWTDREINWLSFIDEASHALAKLLAEWKNVVFVENAS